MEKLCFEDIVVGQPQRYGAYEVTREDVLAFAAEYDPQDFHLDDEAAAAGPFGKLAASGWQTAAITMRLLVDGFLSRQESRGGAGVKDMRWTQPVYPGDVLTLEVEVTGKRRSRSRPDLGLYEVKQRTLNQRGEEVMLLTSTGMIAVRHPEAPIEG